MLNKLKRLWSTGASGAPSRLQRQIELCNQVGLFAVLANTPYQLFYIFFDVSFYRGVLIANFLFMAGYLFVLVLNHKQRHVAASTVLLICGASQLWVVSYFIGAEAGVNLFYFTFTSVLAFLYQALKIRVYGAIMVTLGTLYLLTQFLFVGEAVRTPVPAPWVQIMFITSAVGVFLLSATFLYLFRQHIGRAEDELTSSNEYLQALSQTDPLTGLANRRALDVALERERVRLNRRPEALALMMFDVDHFKRYNDHYGHDGGDGCLQKITQAAKGTLSRSTDLLVRYGGEEFALVLPGTDQQGACQLGEKLRLAIEHLKLPHEGLGPGAIITISVGISSVEHLPSDLRKQGFKALLKRADEALYQAKNNGRNQVVYLPYRRTR